LIELLLRFYTLLSWYFK